MQYPSAGDKIEVLANPVDVSRMVRPNEFDRAARRKELGIAEGDLALLFVALGHFERKGLPLITQAMTHLPASVKLHIVGGEQSLIDAYKVQATSMGLADRVVFHGMQRDVRPFLWCSDLFLLPSVYEVFPLVVLEAAAAGTPILSTPLNGVEDLIRDGENGLIVPRTAEGVQQGIERFLALSQAERGDLAGQAQQDVQSYSVPIFCERWRRVYERSRPPALATGHPVPRHRL